MTIRNLFAVELLKVVIVNRFLSGIDITLHSASNIQQLSYAAFIASLLG